MLISICIPCFKRVEQVRNTLESLYIDNSDVALSDYEVVVTDNDPLSSLRTALFDFNKYPNFRYIPTRCDGFLNSYHALKNGIGELLILHNSQNRMRKGMLFELISQAKTYRNTKPLIFHTNGFLDCNDVELYYDFDTFMRKLSYWSSWSGGMSIWKEDFDNIQNLSINPLFPHTSIFMSQYKKKTFILDDRSFYEVQRVYKRGGHNKFEAFTIHYPSLLFRSYELGHISSFTKDYILKCLCKEYIPTLLFNKYIARIETFDALGFKKNCKEYLPAFAFYIAWINVLFVPFRMIKRRLRQKRG